MFVWLSGQLGFSCFERISGFFLPKLRSFLAQNLTFFCRFCSNFRQIQALLLEIIQDNRAKSKQKFHIFSINYF